MAFFQAVRSAIFYLLFLGQTVILALLLGTLAIIFRRQLAFSLAVATYWSRSTLFLLKWIVGLDSEVTGMENIPPGGCIIGAKHMSDWDIFAIFPHAENPAFIAKKELMRIPFFGWTAASLHAITIDRSKGSSAIPRMMAEARDKLALGCRIVIFPEGTRKKPLAEPDYRVGISRMYTELKVPVVPVALDSGLYWERASLILWPGTARARFMPPIMPGLAPEAFRALLQQRIEAETDAMLAEAIAARPRRPIPANWASKLNARLGRQM